jgi:hypothetical protein
MPRLVALVIVAAFIAGLLPERTAAQSAETREALLAAERCVLAAQLRAVYERPSAFKERNRFLVVSVAARPQSYVQCMFADNRDKLYCEASSFYYAAKKSRPRTIYPSPQAMAALQKLGFATGAAEKNFPYERTALHDAYGAREDTGLKTRAPFAGSLIVACRR